MRYWGRMCWLCKCGQTTDWSPAQNRQILLLYKGRRGFLITPQQFLHVIKSFSNHSCLKWNVQHTASTNLKMPGPQYQKLALRKRLFYNRPNFIIFLKLLSFGWAACGTVGPPLWSRLIQLLDGLLWIQTSMLPRGWSFWLWLSSDWWWGWHFELNISTMTVLSQS